MANVESKMRKLAEFQKESRVQAKDNYKYQSRNRLEQNICKKIDTTMIGSISAVEKSLGYLWGHDKPHAERTDQERRFLLIWDELRTTILNNGNNQKRAVISELHQYDVEWQRHHFDLHVQERRRLED